MQYSAKRMLIEALGHHRSTNKHIDLKSNVLFDNMKSQIATCNTQHCRKTFCRCHLTTFSKSSSVRTIIVTFITHPQEGSICLYWNKQFFSLSLSHPVFLFSEGTRLCYPTLYSSCYDYHDNACSYCDPGCSESDSHCTAHGQRPSWTARFQLPHGSGQREFWQGAWNYSGVQKATMKILDSKSDLNLDFEKLCKMKRACCHYSKWTLNTNSCSFFSSAFNSRLLDPVVCVMNSCISFLVVKLSKDQKSFKQTL